MTTCTVGPSAVTGHRCGKAAVTSFVGSDGVTTYYECADHAANIASAPAPDTVVIRRYGKDYLGRVHHITRTGRVYAEITYGNGVKRVVRVDR